MSGDTRASRRTVREATFDIFREYGLTTLFANPGSTEISLLADLPDGGREAALLGLPHDEMEDLALSARQLFHRALR